MNELRQVGSRTYYIDNPAKMGIFLLDNQQVCLIDSGNDKTAGKMILRHLEAQGWTLHMILNTHSHADHVGGNAFLQERTGCKIFSVGTEPAFVSMPQLEPCFLYGGWADKGLRGKFLQAQPSVCQTLGEGDLPEGLSLQRLDGHAGAMGAFRTADDVWFVADAVLSEETLDKYCISYLFNPAQFLESLDVLEKLEGALFIPSHGQPQEDIGPLAAYNRAKALEVRDYLLHLCRAPLEHDRIIENTFNHFGLTANRGQMAMIGGTVRSYLANLCDEGLLKVEFVGNRMYWKAA